MSARETSKLASLTRKRALRRLARLEYDAYREFYASFKGAGYNKDQARNRAWTLLREKFLDAYLELYAMEKVSPGCDVPPGIRSKSWRRAMALLGDLRKTAYREHYERFTAGGLDTADAAYRASAAVRSQDPELFARLLADEIRMWQSVSGDAREGLPVEAVAVEYGTPPPAGGAGAARAGFLAAVDALKSAADTASRDPGRDPGFLYAVLAERVSELAASVRAERVPRA